MLFDTAVCEEYVEEVLHKTLLTCYKFRRAKFSTH